MIMKNFYTTFYCKFIVLEKMRGIKLLKMLIFFFFWNWFRELKGRMWYQVFLKDVIKKFIERNFRMISPVDK